MYTSLVDYNIPRAVHNEHDYSKTLRHNHEHRNLVCLVLFYNTHFLCSLFWIYIYLCILLLYIAMLNYSTRQATHSLHLCDKYCQYNFSHMCPSRMILSYNNYQGFRSLPINYNRLYSQDYTDRYRCSNLIDFFAQDNSIDYFCSRNDGYIRRGMNLMYKHY